MNKLSAKELRIGNLVNPDNPVMVEAWMLLPESKIVFTPIELTIEWLQNLGFSDIIKNGYFVKYLNPYTNNSQELNNFIRVDATNPPFIENCEIVDYIDGKEDSVFLQEKVKYVHQLQNLYFALTGSDIIF